MVTSGEYSVEGKAWEGISLEAKNLVKALLNVNPEERLNTQDVIAHTWMNPDN
jgi:hypothetical protein